MEIWRPSKPAEYTGNFLWWYKNLGHKHFISDWGSPQGLELIKLHEFYIYVCSLIIIVILIVIYMVLRSPWSCGGVRSGFIWRDFPKKNNPLEFGWTIGAIIGVIILGFFNVDIIYKIGASSADKFINLKVTGHQWYWEYEYFFDIYRLLLNMDKRWGCSEDLLKLLNDF